MACKVIKKVLGYELCILEPEGTLFYSDPVVLIRKDHFSEIYNLQKHDHEIGDYIGKEITRKQVYQFIEDNIELFSEELRKAK